MRNFTTRPWGHATAPLARSRHHPLLRFACARMLELRALAERSGTIDQRHSRPGGRPRSLHTFRKLPH
jgi:hypothetical protein